MSARPHRRIRPVAAAAFVSVLLMAPGSTAVGGPSGPDALAGGSAGGQLARSAAAPQPAPDGAGPRPEASDVALAIHCGTAPLRRDVDPPELAAAFDEALRAALTAGYAVVDNGGRALDAVQAAVVVLEDFPLCNAGRGAVFNTDAEHQLDAAIMDGADLRSGAVAAVENVRNPIQAARLVMDESPHVLMVAEGADDFAARAGLATVTQDYYWTQQRWDALMAAKKDAAVGASAAEAPAGQPADQPGEQPPGERGTVGAVAVDSHGDLAAATSTGGLTNKLVGRVGDSPIVGAGTYADSDVVAVSATGTGEAFIRTSAARDIAALMEYRRLPVARAAQDVIDKVDEIAGGAVIALDPRGDLATPRTDALLYAWITSDGEITTRVYRD